MSIGQASRIRAVAGPAVKIPESVLVVIHTFTGMVLLLERADHPGFWQSVTGSRNHADEPLPDTCRREVLEETGIDCPADAYLDWHLSHRYEIYPAWRNRYAPGVTHNTEHVFSLGLAGVVPVKLEPTEHLRFQWLPWRDAADRCFSQTNVAAIRALAGRGLLDGC